MGKKLDGLYINITSDDESYADSPAKYIKFQEGNDKLIFAATEPVSMSETDLDAAQTVVSGIAKEISNLYLWDDSAAIFRYIPLAGSGANRYVFCLHMTDEDATLTEPDLRVWDDNSYTTNNLTCLGSGDSAQSYVHAIETRIAGTPIEGWVGTKISGDTGLGLNNGEPLDMGEVDLYFNLYIKIPADVSRQEKENPVFCVRYLYGD